MVLIFLKNCSEDQLMMLCCEKLVFFAIFRHNIAFLNLQLNAPTLQMKRNYCLQFG